MREMGFNVPRTVILLLLVLQGLNLMAQCPASIFSITESCEEQEPGIFNIAVDIVADLNEGCTLNEVCYSRQGDGEQLCIDVVDLGLGSGDVYHLELPGPGMYYFWVSTDTESSELIEQIVNCYDNDFSCQNPFAVNYNLSLAPENDLACVYDTYVCDCSGNIHSQGVMIYLGDGEYEVPGAGKEWNGVPVDFTCNVWGFDCGDGNINFDPYGVCDGNLPPNNGCSSPGCTPLTLSIQQNPCETTPDGLTSSLLLQFGISSGCEADVLCFSINQGDEQCITLDNVGNQGNYLLPLVGQFGSYKFHFETTAGAVSPFFYFNAEDLCGQEEKLCDCAGNNWPVAFADRIGDGFFNDGTPTFEGYQIDFNCLVWGFDCADGDGGLDPYQVCSGNIPPENGCIDEPVVPGCIDPEACNYQAGATFDDNSCDYSCFGCTDPLACNYDTQAFIETDECTYPEPGYDCLGNCIDDSDGDGICDENEVMGCTYEFACNYNPEATQEDGSCERSSCVGCTNFAAANYDPDALMDDGSCVFDFSAYCPADLDSNEQVSISDLLILIGFMGLQCEGE